MTILYKSDPVRGAEWARLHRGRAPDLEFRIWPDAGDPAAVRYVIAWTIEPGFLAQFPNLEVLFCTGAGVDRLGLANLPPSLPVVRMVEPGIVEGMGEYVTMAVLSVHRDAYEYARLQARGEWKVLPVKPASATRVGVLGAGVLGQHVLGRLAAFGFPCAAWSRTRPAIAGVEGFEGAGELPAFLARTDVLVCLLPLTDETRGILSAGVFAALPRGASVVNVARGGHLVERDLLAALDSGHLAEAVIDVMTPEPLPAGHPYWAHPRVHLTPHIASETQIPTAVDALIANVRAHRAGLPMRGLIDRAKGY